MKIYIHAADEPMETEETVRNPKTTFYKATLDEVDDALKKENLWIQKSFKESGFECIDTEKGLFGTRVIDDVLYICDTNGEDIMVNGDEVDPEKALDNYDLADLSAYIKDATPAVIRKNIDEYTIRKPRTSEFNDWAKSMLRDGEDFESIAKDYMEIWGD